jgi:hypothetical protein
MPGDLEFEQARVSNSPSGADTRVAQVRIANRGDRRLHVWSTPRAVTYDSATHTLSAHFFESPVTLGEGFRVISHHTSAPTLITLEPGGVDRLEISVPPTLHVVDLTQFAGGLALPIQQVNVGPIDNVAIGVAVLDTPISEPTTELSPQTLTARLQREPRIVSATVAVTSPTEDAKDM